MTLPASHLSLLHQRLFSVEQEGENLSLSLPEVLAALCGKRVIEFIALRPHQQQPWHAFLVQVAVLAKMAWGRWPDANVAHWKEALLALTDEQEGPWCLLQEVNEPAFMQPALPDGQQFGKNARMDETPDGRDLPVTAKGWDLKMATIRSAQPEHWIYMLVTVQTTAGYNGLGNYGVTRIKSGFASRPGVTMANSLTWNAMFKRDCSVAFADHEALCDAYHYKSKHTLLWTVPWDGISSLPLRDLDPLSVEVCRMLRLCHEGGQIVCLSKATKAPRVDAGDASGVVGDLWMPIACKDKAPATGFNITPRGITYRVLHELLLDPERFRPAPTQRLRSSDVGAPTFVVRGIARDESDNGNTGGYHERFLPIPNDLSARWEEKETRAILSARSMQQLETTNNVRLRVFKPALCMLLQGGPPAINLKDKRCDPWLARLEQVFDGIFFEHLWSHFEKPEAEAASVWDQTCVTAAFSLLNQAEESSPHDRVTKVRAFAKALNMASALTRKNFASCQVSRAT